MSSYQSPIKRNHNIWKVILLLILTAFTLHVRLATCGPLTFDTDVFGEPKPGSSITYIIKLYTYRRLDVKVKICYYLPGYGWSDWETIWEGELEGEKIISEEIYIPSNVDTGSIAIWVDVHYIDDNAYAIIDNKYYYVATSEITIAGTVYGGDYRQLIEDYNNLKAEHDSLRESYNEQLHSALHSAPITLSSKRATTS